ncbi:hypothetical protein GCM10011378_07200 [Hymenobacter glacieicola]|uniref:Uncharacterized protein n=1 Tax=Hymenobacter glacieicola TaxID=1562124 RepID=A0ABQ1WJQ9_9BACT|nr:hypothetical protein GCM10011378_07200 [Hymenobacter glacieicola]
MARDLTLLTDRNKEIMAAFNKLKCEEQIVPYRGKRIAIHLSYNQIMTILSNTYFLSRKRLEFIITQSTPKMAPINASASPVTAAAA